jgi:choline dehydrogenase
MLRAVRFDVVVVGGGTAGSVLAARLSESPDRTVCLLEAGPDYGALADGRWPDDVLDARSLSFSHSWGSGGEDERSLGARVLGGSSAANACMVVSGSPADYDEWGPEWSYAAFRPHLERAKAELRTAPANTSQPARFHTRFLEAAHAVGIPLVNDVDDPEQPVGAGPFPANVVDGRRWNAALAYLDPARDRGNLEIVGDTLVDRVLVDNGRAGGVVTVDGHRVEAGTVLLAAGAYFTPAILMRSGIGPEAELRRHGIVVLEDLPVGERLLDHCGTGAAWTPSAELDAELERHRLEHGLFEAHAVAKVASSRCPHGTWDTHLLSWASPSDTPARYVAHVLVFHMKPRSAGRVSLRSAGPTEPPLVQRGFLQADGDLEVIVEGLELARSLAAADPLGSVLGEEVSPGGRDLERYVRESVRNYFHPAGTCPLGPVLDAGARVLGVDGLLVADASLMPTIPRANTNLTTAAIAERVAASLG